MEWHSTVRDTLHRTANAATLTTYVSLLVPGVAGHHYHCRRSAVILQRSPPQHTEGTVLTARAHRFGEASPPLLRSCSYAVPLTVCPRARPVPQVTHISDSASSGERSPRRHHGMAPDGATVKLVRRWQSRSHPQVACDRRAAHTACSCIASGRATANHTAATRIAASNATTVNAATLPLAWLGCSSGDQRTKHSLELLNLLTSRKPVKTPRAIRDPASNAWRVA